MPTISMTQKVQAMEVICIGEVQVNPTTGLPDSATVKVFTKDGYLLGLTNFGSENLRRLPQQRSPFADLLEIPPRQETASARQGQSQDAGAHSVCNHSLSMNKP